MEPGKEKLILKFIFLGAPRSGKSCTLLRYAEDTFFDQYITTIGVDFKIKYIPNLHPEKTLCLQVWDEFRSCERFRPTPPAYYRNANAIFVFFDITDRESFEHIKSVVEKIPHTQAAYQEIYIIGNKVDLESKRAVSKEEANQFAIDHGAFKYIEMSAKDSINVIETFDEIAKSFFFRRINDPIPTPLPSSHPNGSSKSRCMIQ